MTNKILTKKEWRAALQKLIDAYDWDSEYVMHMDTPHRKWHSLPLAEYVAIIQSTSTKDEAMAATEAALKKQNGY
tara:strand:+ start:121 stop:345 length:225 start_codon:yes stop_codon:yes gene_type:complete